MVQHFAIAINENSMKSTGEQNEEDNRRKMYKI